MRDRKMVFLRLSDLPLSQKWLTQFTTPEDRNKAKSLLNSLKYVSTREFEDAITSQLENLQISLNATIAVYPVISPPVEGVQGSDLFTGNFLNPAISAPNRDQQIADGKRRKYGSEDRVGHLLERICAQQEGTRNHSKIECTPTLKTIKNQGINHIVLVDDICGSGKRITDFYKKILPKSLKRQISLDQIKLWVVLYAASNQGIQKLQKEIKYFNKYKNKILIAFPTLDSSILDINIKNICLKYSHRIYGENSDASGLGYKNSIGGVVFEHGCPNNLPDILWVNNKNWKAIFKNRAIPHELKPAFSPNSTAETGEVLWNIGQKYLALSLYDAIDTGRLSVDEHLLIGLLGMLLRQVKPENIAGKLLIEHTRYESLLQQAYDKYLLEPRGSQNTIQVSAFGKALVEKFRTQKSKKIIHSNIDVHIGNYYPMQCDGHLQYSGSLPSDSKEGSTD